MSVKIINPGSPLSPLTGPPDTDFDRLDKRLRGTEMKMVYIGVPDPDYMGGQRRLWNLAGSQGGREALDLAPHLTGMMMNPFSQLVSEGPYQIGGHYERTDYGKRVINLGVMVGNSVAPDTSFRYRMLEQRWWASWSPTQDGYLGVFTRSHGWRWLRVRLAEEPKTPFDLDPAAFENNFMQWDMTIMALDPYWYKPTEISTPWKNTEATSIETNIVTEFLAGLLGDFILKPGEDVGVGHIRIPNRGNQEAWPKFVIDKPGYSWIQDGIDGPMVRMPLLEEADVPALLDTDPNARTLTGRTDPVDPLFFKILRNSQLIDFLLHDLLESTLPLWRRFDGKGFFHPIAPRSLATIEVRHSAPDGVITAYLPQRYSMAYG